MEFLTSYISAIKGSSRKRLIECFLITIAFLILYAGVIFKVVIRWFTHPHFYGQGALIFGIFLYMIWTKRKEIKNIVIKPAVVSGFIVSLMGCFLLYTGKITETGTVYEISIVLTLFGLTLLLFGVDYLMALFIPLTYLIFIFPIFDFIPGPHILFLQKVTALIASKLLVFGGISVYHSGYTLELPHITLSVVKACAGVNHIMSLLAMAVFLGYFTNKSRAGKLLLIAVAIVLGILANGARVALIGFWTYYNPDAGVHGPADFLLVSFIFIIGLFMLVFLSSVIAKMGLNRDEEEPEGKTIAAHNQNSANHFSVAAILAICLFMITSWVLYSSKIEPVYLQKDLKDVPKKIADWTGYDIDELKEPFERAKAEFELKRIYKDPDGNHVQLYIGYFSLQDEDKEIFNSHYNSTLRLLPDTEDVQIYLPGLPDFSLRKFQYESNNKERIGYASYVINNKFYANQYLAKFATLRNIIIQKRSNASIVIITTNYHENINDELKGTNILNRFAREISPLLITYLKT